MTEPTPPSGDARPPLLKTGGAVFDHYLGFRAGDTVLDLAELTAGTAVIKEFVLLAGTPFDPPQVVAVMTNANGAERAVAQLKKVRPAADHAAPDGDATKVVPLKRRPR